MITQEDIEKKIKNVHHFHVPGTTTVMCAIELSNGFVVTGEAACVFKQFDLEKGKEIAFGKAKGKVWELEAYIYKEEEFRDKIISVNNI